MRRRYPWRRNRISHYERIVAEVLLQRTQADNVARFWSSFIKQFPTWRSLANSPVERIAQCLLPIGLSNQKAPRLKSLAGEMARRRGRFPSERNEIESLPGVGQYIANSIELFCFGKPRPLLDSSMARVIERYDHQRKLKDIRYDGYLQGTAKQLVRGSQSRDISWAILDLAAILCLPGVPRCPECPLLAKCNYPRRRRTTQDSALMQGPS